MICAQLIAFCHSLINSFGYISVYAVCNHLGQTFFDITTLREPHTRREGGREGGCIICPSVLTARTVMAYPALNPASH